MNKKVSCDASVLINFLCIDRVDLLGKCSLSFFITDHVDREISHHYPAQRAQLDAALHSRSIGRINVETEEELSLFAELSKSGQLGAGECAAIAIATQRGLFLAIDDHQAVKRASLLLSADRILRTQDLLLRMIEETLLKLEEADHFLKVWATSHRFRLKIQTFKELLPHCTPS